MRKFNTCLFFLLFWMSYASGQRVYKYYLHLSSHNEAHEFTMRDGLMKYAGNNDLERFFFEKYDILHYHRAFEDAVDDAAKNIFYIETYDSAFVEDLKSEFPGVYLIAEDVTNWTIELLDYYPNDYGSSSPYPNFGFDYNRKEYDYINVPKAWGITTGDSGVKIGISDTPIYYTDPDFLNKVFPIVGYNLSLVANSHGTNVAATAAARGNNAYGSAGVCMDCSIVAAPMGINPSAQYSTLYKMALEGARIINMSWTNSGYLNLDTTSPYYTPSSFPILAEQLAINDVVNNFGVTLVAASGNSPSLGTPASNAFGAPYGVIHVFPASYDNVISVGSIGFQHPIVLPLNSSQSSYCCTSSLYPIYLELEDSVSRATSGLDPMNPVAVLKSGYNVSPTNTDGFIQNLTLNERVDILAPGYGVMGHNQNIPRPVINGGRDAGTSFSAPTVAGTIGLMLSVNNCLNPKEIESILKLTTKDIENMPLNYNFFGYVGAGKLEVGNAVEFTDEMKKIDGVAMLSDHIFNRYVFDLHNFNNNLNMVNIVFKQKSVADFTARNNIDVIDSDFAPSSDGFIDLKINENLDRGCATANRFTTRTNKNDTASRVLAKSVLFPNPNNGYFTIVLADNQLKNITAVVYDVLGKPVFNIRNVTSNTEISLPNLASGIYFISLSGQNFNETIKFIKK